MTGPTFLGHSLTEPNADLDAAWNDLTGPGLLPSGRTTPSLAEYIANNAVHNVNDYGAVGDGTTDDAQAFRDVLAVLKANGGGVLALTQHASYRLASEVLTQNAEHIVIQGNGATISATTKFRSYFRFESCAGLTVRDLNFDLAQPLLPTFTESEMASLLYFNLAFDFESSSDILVENCNFENLYTWGLFFYGCSGRIDLLNNSHSSPAQLQGSRAEHIAVQTCSANILVDNCSFLNARPSAAGYGVTAMYFSGVTGSVAFTRNILNYCGRNYTVAPHQLGALACYGDVKNVRVLGNIFLNCLERVIRMTSAHEVWIERNYMHMSDLALGDNMVSLEGTSAFLPTGLGGNVDHVVRGNVFIDENTTQRVGVLVGAYDWATPSENIIVCENIFWNMKYAAQIAGPFRNVEVRGNIIRGLNPGQILVNWEPPGAGVLSATGVPESEGIYDDLVINGNTWDIDPSSVASFIFVNLVRTPDPLVAKIGTLELSDNTVGRDGTLVAVQAVIIRGTTGKGKYLCLDNTVRDSQWGFDFASANEIRIENNDFENVTTPTLDAGSNGYIGTQGNRFGTGPQRGRVTLVAGTATVLTNEVRSTDNFRLTRVVAGGTLGHLSIGTIVNGVSFVINSSSASDTSTVFWEPVH